MIMNAEAIALTAMAVGSAAYGQAQQNKMENRAKNQANASLEDHSVMVRSSSAPASCVYGRTRMSGPIVFASTTGANKEYLHLVVALTRHECDAIESVMLNDEVLPAEDPTTGLVETGSFATSTTHYEQELLTINGSGVATLAHVASSVTSVSTGGDGYDSIMSFTSYTHTPPSATISGLPTDGKAYYAYYSWEGGGEATVKIRKHLGQAGQVADADLVADSGGLWTASDVGVSTTYVYVRLKYVTDIYGQIGIPNISVILRGKKVYDPRSGLTVWSENPALCTADYLKDTRFGLRASPSEIVDAELIIAANICDEDVTIINSGTCSVTTGSPEVLHNGADWRSKIRPNMIFIGPDGVRYEISLVTTYLGTIVKMYLKSAYLGTSNLAGAYSVVQKRYTANGALNSTNSPWDNLLELTKSMSGSVIWVQGRWLIRAGSHLVPTHAVITEDYLADTPIEIMPRRGRRELFNGAIGKFLDISNDYGVAEYPAYTSATYEAEDGEQILTTIDYQLVTDPTMAQRLGKIEVLRGRQALTVKLSTNLKAYNIVPSDTVYVTLARYGWTNKLFVVLTRKFALGGTIEYLLQETAAQVWDWAFNEATNADPAPNTDLPSPYTIPAVLTDLTAASGTVHLHRASDGTVVSRVLVSWTQSTELFVLQGGSVEVFWSISGQSDWESAGSLPGDTESVYLSGMVDGSIINIRIRQVNSMGRTSPYTLLSHLVVGKTEPPSDVTGLTGSVSQGLGVLVWDTPPDLDYDVTELRFDGTGWADATHLFIGRANTYSQKVETAGTYVIRAKHIDTSGNFSVNVTNFSLVVAPEDLAGSGAGASSLQLNATGFAFVFDDENDTTAEYPGSIDFTVVLQGVSGTADFSGTAYDAAGAVVGSVGGITFTNETANFARLTAANFNAAGTTSVRYVIVTATLGALSDTMTIYRGDNGSSAVQAMMTNEAHTLPTTTAGVVTYTGSGTTIRVFEGTSELDYDGVGTAAGKWTASRSVSSGTISTPGALSESGLTAVMADHAGMSTTAAQVTVTITGKTLTGASFPTITKVQSLAKSWQGNTGADGTTAQTIELGGSAFAFIFSDVNATAATEPASITFTAALQNVTGTVTFSALAYDSAGGSLGSVSLTGSGVTRSMTKAAFVAPGGTRYAIVTASIPSTNGTGTLTDTFTVYRGDNGSNAITAVLSNDSHTIPTDSAGNNGVYTGSGSIIRVFEGTTELDYDGVGTAVGKWTATRTASGITAGAISESGLTGVMAQHSAMTADTATVTISITGKTLSGGAFSLTKLQTLSKSKSGTGGARGSARVYWPANDDFQRYPTRVSPKAKWARLGTLTGTNDTEAQDFDADAESYLLGEVGASALVVGDELTATNVAGTASATGWWDGTQWVDPGTVIDGNLLVEGTVTALGVNAVYTLAVQDDAITVPRASTQDFTDITITATTEAGAQQMISQTFVVPAESSGKDSLPNSRLITGAIGTIDAGSAGSGTGVMVIERVLSGTRTTLFQVGFSYDSQKPMVVTIPVSDAATLTYNATYTYAIRIFKNSGGGALVVGGASISILGTKGR